MLLYGWFFYATETYVKFLWRCYHSADKHAVIFGRKDMEV